MYRKDQDEKKADGQRYVGLAWHEKHNINGFGGRTEKQRELERKNTHET